LAFVCIIFRRHREREKNIIAMVNNGFLHFLSCQFSRKKKLDDEKLRAGGKCMQLFLYRTRAWKKNHLVESEEEEEAFIMIYY
jgi:hypothetical protein